MSLFYSLADIRLCKEAGYWKKINHVFKHYTILITAEGTGRIIVEGTGYQLERGTGFFLQPGLTHGIEAGEQGLSYYQLGFDVHGSTSSQLKPADGILMLRPGAITCQPFSQCMLLVNTISRHWGEGGQVEAFHNHIRFQELLLFIIQRNAVQNRTPSERESVQRTVEYIQENYYESLNVERLAEMSGISRWRYTQVFKEITGQIPLEYLNGIRMDRAQQLLLMTDDRLYDIALSVGYSNEYYFNRKFKQMIGASPGQYRRRQHHNPRVFAPFMEDYLLALGITPVAQMSHALWGKQDYLGLDVVPEIDISIMDVEQLSVYRPELILLDAGFDRWHLEKCKQLAPLFKFPFFGEDWRTALYSLAPVFGKMDEAREAIHAYEKKAEYAKKLLSKTMRGQTVAVLRISACSVSLYGDVKLGYIGNVMYKDLGLQPHPFAERIARGERRVELSEEQLGQLDADHLFITFDRREGEGREILKSKIWNSLPAVRSRRVYEVDFMSWMNYGVLSHIRKIDDVLRVLA